MVFGLAPLMHTRVKGLAMALKEGGAKGAFDLPFAKAFVPRIDLAAKALTVALPDDFFETPVRPSEEDVAGEGDDSEGDEVERP